MMLGAFPPPPSPLAGLDGDPRASTEILCDRLWRLREIARALAGCASPEEARRAVPAVLETIPARLLRLVDGAPGAPRAIVAWPDLARTLPHEAEAATPARAALASRAAVWLEGSHAIAAASVQLAAVAAALGLEAWGAVPLPGHAVLELGLAAAPRLDATERAYLAVAAALVGWALVGAGTTARAPSAAPLEPDPAAALEAFAAGLVIATTDGEVESINRAALQLLAIDDVERSGIRSVPQLLERAAVEWPDGRRVVLRETPFARARAGETVRDVLLRFAPPDQPCRWVLASAVPLGAPGAVRHVAITIVDVTRTRELEEEQRSLVREMYDRLAPPIRFVRAQALRVQAGAAKSPEEAGAVAREISRAAVKMEAAMREIESALRVDSRALAATPELVDVKAFVLDLLERAGAPLDVGRVFVSAPPGLPKAFVDPDHLERMLVELVQGAVEGAAEGTDVLVACAAGEGVLRITVASTGPDVLPADLCHVFDRFYRAHGRMPGRFYAVRLLAEANRGRVLAESGQGRGLAITVELPSRAP